MEKNKDEPRGNDALQSGHGDNVAEGQDPREFGQGREPAGDRSAFSGDRDLDPKIGQSKGSFATGEDPELIDGENTVEGDVENDSTYGGGADPSQLGRTNA